MATRLTGPGPDEMRLLAAKLKTADARLKRELRRSFGDAAAPVADAVRESIRQMPAKEERGLRDEVAGTIRTTITTGASIRVTVSSLASRMPPGKGNMPKHLDSRSGWGHPVFGRARTWVRQLGRPQWFETPIANRADDFRAAADEAMNATARELGGE